MERKNSYSSLLVVCLLVCAVSVLTVGSAFAQVVGTIKGAVTAVETSEALPGANISVAGTLRGASVTVDGKYAFRIEPGTYTVRASFIGYSSVEKKVQVVAGETVTVDFQLAETPVEFGESLVVLGSRTARTAVETPVPVDVISAKEVRESGQLEVNQALTYLAPSFNASHQTIADGTDQVNPASLRGLGPDQVLVLVNGKRRHKSALVHVNGTFGRGTVGVDLNAIPKASIERIEVLRDGAAAQYGSDAIAGVINIVLKQQTEKIQVNTMTGTTGSGDGDQIALSANYGFRIGERGFVNVTGEFFDRGRTNRSDPFQGPLFFTDRAKDDAELARRGLTRRQLSMKTGQGKATVGAAFINSAFSISENAEFYAFGEISGRKGKSTGFYRRPIQEAKVVFEIFPNGFLPEIDTQIDDRSFTAGLRGNRNGWDVDFSVTHGVNTFQFNIENTDNASLGTATPLSFDAGRLEFRQTTGNLDIVRPIDTKGVINSLSLNFGGEFRIDKYEIKPGQFESFSLGNGGDRPGIDFDTTSTGAPKLAGSQVFPGFQPSNAVARFRNGISIYGGVESEITDQLLIDIGGRFENFSDFGARAIGKIAGRFKVVEDFALRAAVSTGFRAPSLHQAWFNNVSTQFLTDPETGELVAKRVLTANNKSPVTKAFGIPNLKEETSINVSAGFTTRPHPKFSFTADYYHIEIDDRIVLTSRFTNANPTFAKLLEPFQSLGVSQAQFFANAVDTKTNGLDIVAAYFTPLGRGRLSFTGALNLSYTDVQQINIPKESIDVFRKAEGRDPTQDELNTIANTLFNREEFNRLETALPRQKANISARYSIGPFSALGRASYFGEVKYRPTNPLNDEDFSAKVLFDVDVAYEILPGVRFSVGANDLFDTFPDKHGKPAERAAKGLNSNYGNGNFVYSRRVTQFGMNGGFYYSRLQFDL
ncbi:MAG: TonB-dependent receptor domain-containing protein [bacterium]